MINDKTQTVENKIKTTNSTSTQRLGVPYMYTIPFESQHLCTRT